ncbi:hypothetical protein K502DRAFT_327976 [Neoconidiobolus thromboides FSU 785]|nr:hypothetical protein K502DRAFT_327976 [Neoconidiobolus thromboides FSU 785]
MNDDIFERSQYDNVSNEQNNMNNEFYVFNKVEIGDLKIYDEISKDVLNKTETLKLISANSELKERYNKLKKMIIDINKQMVEFNSLFGSKKVKLLKRKKKECSSEDKLIKKSNDDMIINGVLDGKIPIKTGAEILGLSYNTFHTRICRKKKKIANNIGIDDLRKNGNNKKVNEETNDFIYDYISRNHETTLLQVRDFLLTKQIDISKSTISRLKNNLDITYKQKIQIRNRWNDKDIILKRKQYIEEYKILMTCEFIYIDEIYFNRHAVNQGEFASEGQRIILTPESTPKSINYIGAISQFQIETFKIIDKKKTNTNNQEDFNKFIMDLYSKNRHKQIVYVFNSTNPHVIPNELKEAIRYSNSFILILPEYSVFLNPIELFFNELKVGVNKLPHCENSDVIKNILKVQNKVGDAKHCNNYFQHVRNYITPCENNCMFKGNIFKPETLLITDSVKKIN